MEVRPLKQLADDCRTGSACSAVEWRALASPNARLCAHAADQRVCCPPPQTAAAFAFVIGTLLALPSASSAQGLRADVIAAEQAEKARHLGPGAPTRAEQIVAKVRDTFLQPRDGLYPFMDSVYGGGGFTLGAGFLRYYGDRSTADVHGLYSIRNYKLFEVTTTSPGPSDGRLQSCPGGLARRDPRRVLRAGHRDR